MGDEDELSTEEKLVRLEQQLQALTPEFIAKKVDEALSDPDNIASMQERGVSIEELAAKKPEMVEKLHTEMQGILEILPEMDKAPEELINEQVDKAIQDFPKMFDDALNAEITESISAADKRIQKKFKDASTQIRDAENYLENGELPADPDSDLNKAYAPAVIDMADKIMQMRMNEPPGTEPSVVEVYRPAMEGNGSFGQEVMELVDQRILDLGADVSAPAGMGVQ